jgi:hypothetical protein
VSETAAGWRAVKAAVWLRAGGQVEVVLAYGRCPRRAEDPHHALKRSASGADHPDNVVGVCKPHHRQTDWPFQRGRLVITPLGGGRFACRIVRKRSKWDPDPEAA